MAKLIVANLTTLLPGQNGKQLAVLDNVTFETEDRELLVFVGPRQSGVSSLVRTIAGLDPISHGDLAFDDRSINQIAPKDRDIAFVSRGHVPYPKMSVRDNLAFALKRRKFAAAEIQKRILAAAEMFRLSESLADKAAALSAEQLQRLAMARATVLQPQLLLLDEPFENLSFKARAEMRQDLLKLHQRRATTIPYATQDPTEALALGDRIVVLRAGVIQQIGTADSIYNEPENVFVAELFGTPAMNLIGGTIRQERDNFLFTELGDGTVQVHLPMAQFRGAESYNGKQVLLGIRPEQISIAEPSGGENRKDSFPAIVERAEKLGSLINVYLQTGTHTVASQTPHHQPPAQARHRLSFTFDPAKVCLFDPVSGSRLRNLA